MRKILSTPERRAPAERLPPSLRLVLSMIGPYDGKTVTSGTTFALLRDAVYDELKKLTLNFAHRDAKMEHFLPEHVTFDDKSVALIFNFPSDGSIVSCDVRGLNLKQIDLLEPANFIEVDQKIVLAR